MLYTHPTLFLTFLQASVQIFRMLLPTQTVPLFLHCELNNGYSVYFWLVIIHLPIDNFPGYIQNHY